MLHETYALTIRELKHWYRVRVQILMTLIQPVVWLGLFGQAFQLPIPPSALGGAPNYFSYMAIGMLAVTTLFTCMFGGFSLVWDRRFGFLTKLKVAPIPRGAVPLSRITATMVRAMVQAIIVFLIALAFTLIPGLVGLSLSPQFNVVDLLGLFFVLALLALAFAAVFISIALTIENQETLMAVVNLLNLPIMFASAALFPMTFMPQWLQTVANCNPLTWAVDAARTFVFHSASPINPLWLDITALAVFCSILVAVSFYVAKKQLSAK
ncbi:MAG: ABC transporter permease [Methanomassiliicoccales archaeon]|nr:ABC transporter permease [Methanomassiliicoccales archaeon]